MFRVTIADLAGAWLLTEVADTLFPALGVPEWGICFVVIVIEVKHLVNRFDKSHHDLQVSNRCASTAAKEASHAF